MSLRGSEPLLVTVQQTEEEGKSVRQLREMRRSVHYLNKIFCVETLTILTMLWKYLYISRLGLSLTFRLFCPV